MYESSIGGSMLFEVVGADVAGVAQLVEGVAEDVCLGRGVLAGESLDAQRPASHYPWWARKAW